MRTLPRHLLNTPEIEAWPAHLVRARSNHVARILAGATHVLRRKSDGLFLAATADAGLVPLAAAPRFQAPLRHALERVRGESRMPPGERDLPLARIAHRLALLGLDEHYARRTGLALVPEPSSLQFAGYDRYRRPLWLRTSPARAWRSMREAAARDGIALDAISGYRSHDYQLGIFERKLARGQSVDEILAVNAAPGYSEHHSGRALDIGTPGEPPAEESFEATAAFAWLRENAGAYDFVMSYPRDNPYGIVYEPWHWYHAPGAER